MIILNFKVENQRLTPVDIEYLANKTHNILKCVFDINGDDWEDKSIFAILWNSKHKAYQLYLEDNEVIIPSDIVKGRRFKISLYAYFDDTRITTNQLTINLAESGYTEDIEDLEDVDVDIWSQIFDGLNSKANIADLHNVAFTGDYNNLENIPELYDADDITIIRNNTYFSVKDNSIGSNQLHEDVNASLDYADNWNSSVAKNITDDDIINWNNKQDINIVTTLDNVSDTTYPSSKCVKEYINNLIGGLNEYVNR